MQPDEERQWHLAQTDFRLSVFLVQATLLMLAAGGLNRSVDTVVYVAIGTLILILGSLLLTFLGMMALMPLIMFLNPPRHGRWTSLVPQVSAAYAWSELIVLVLVVVLMGALGVASLEYGPLRSLWATPPSPIAIPIFIAAVIAVVINLRFQHLWEQKLFMHPEKVTLTKRADGTTLVTIHHTENDQQNQSQSSKNDQSNSEPNK